MEDVTEARFRKYGESKYIDLVLFPYREGNEGMEGWKNFVQTFVDSKNGNRREIGLFLKEFSSEDKLTPQMIFERHHRLKEIGLPVVPTLRMSDDNKLLLMTDLTYGGKYEIVDRHNIHPNNLALNSSVLAEQIKKIARKASENGFYLNIDAYTLVIDKKTKEGKIFLSDLSSGVETKYDLEESFRKSIRSKYMTFEDYKDFYANNFAASFIEAFLSDKPLMYN
ncbi:hypothetical protein A2771_03005 [Candidatus Woesebacteria bacterium RIFCSPHIGHO2_01_FULL_38_26b]|uniref:Protein kinase domain-containing protein n=1 Tax=Candidatus Woesebacteria bacterium RIFCSPHIGHO2_01_FULL_38_26b TaxID=1802491 RepID=A0A1F7XYT4_9BACT|nr:MAG: hypothetical protein A2771_03005 [Candidatus Woesebacteria bacterium RIFCSPHIGHO2_01_FULL_38_26b]